jgi:hypothetical protein
MSLEDDSEDALDPVLKSWNGFIGAKPKRKMPEPDIPADLTPDQKKILNELPDTPGFYWVEDIRSNERNVAYIDKRRTLNAVEHWGHKMDATFGGIAVIERWLMGWSILTEVASYKEPVEYTENANYGVF